MENRIHNAVNEVLSICRHDANGNMTTMPKPNGDGVLNCVYDAWNRLVAVNSNIRYEYNGLNQRIKKTVGTTVTTSFFNERWQELESRTDGISTTCVWGLRYIDDLIYRERNEERLYSLADPNWNVVAAVDKDTAIQERFQYDAFGKVHGLNSHWNRTFTGQVLDTETGLTLYRNRFYHAGLGRFISRDPIAYLGNDINLYRYVKNNSKRHLDHHGLQRSLNDDQKRICCEAAKTVGIALGKKPGGATTCCCGETITCNYMDDFWNTFKSRLAWGIVNACFDAHENSHVLDFNCKGKDFGEEGLMSDVSDEATECMALYMEGECLRIGLKVCGENKTCQMEVNEMLNKVLKDKHENCGKFMKEIPGPNLPIPPDSFPEFPDWPT